MNTVRVAAIKAFAHGGRSVEQGSIIDVPAIEAAILARKGLVSLDRRYMTADLTPVADAVDESPRRRRQYRRRDLVPEP